jgi:hypothetical protein
MNYKFADDLSIRAIGEEIFILKRNTSTIHSFNKTGTFIWKLLQEKKSHSEIVELLLKRFDMKKDVVENDLSDFLFGLSKNQILIISE